MYCPVCAVVPKWLPRRPGVYVHDKLPRVRNRGSNETRRRNAPLGPRTPDWLHRRHLHGATMHQTCLDSLFSGSLRRRGVSLLALERLKRLGSAGQAIDYLAKHA